MSAPQTPRPTAAERLPHGLHQSAPDTGGLESALGAVELRIAALGDSLTRPDPQATELAANELRAALGSAMSHFAQVARSGIVPPVLRRRLALASAQMAAQREALARATSALDQAMDILMPRATPAAVYTPYGASARTGTGKVIAAS